MSSAFWKFRQPKLNKAKIFVDKTLTTEKEIKSLSTDTIKVDKMKNIRRRCGFSWTIEQLRLKSNNDLKSLYSVLLKQKIAVQSDIYYATQNQVFTPYLADEEKKLITSMNRIKALWQYRENLSNNTMKFFEFFHYKKEKIMKYMSQKNNNQVKLAIFSPEDDKNFKEFSERINLIKKIHGIDKQMNLTDDWIEVRKLIPHRFDSFDYFFLNTLDLEIKSDLLSDIKKLGEFLLRFDSLPYSEANKSLKFIFTSGKETKFTLSQAKKRLYNKCTSYLDSCRRLFELKIKKVDDEIKEGKYKDIPDIEKLFKENKEHIDKEINLEYYFIEVLNDKEKEYANVRINSRFVNENIKRALLYPINDEVKSEDSMTINTDTDNSVTVLNNKEIKMVKNLKQITSALSLLPQYVKNTEQLRSKSKRKLLYEIQKGRAKIARDIFIKEMAAVSYKAKNMTNNI